MANLIVNNDKKIIFISSSSNTGSGIINFIINSGIPGYYNVLCWTLTNQGIGYSQPFNLTNTVFNVTILNKTKTKYFKTFKLKAQIFLSTPINFEDIFIDVRTISNKTIRGINDFEISLEIAPYSSTMEYTDKIFPILIKNILGIGINFFLTSNSEMFIIPTYDLKNKVIVKYMNTTSYVLSDEEILQIKDYDVNQLSNFIYDKFGGKIFNK